MRRARWGTAHKLLFCCKCMCTAALRMGGRSDEQAAASMRIHAALLTVHAVHAQEVVRAQAAELKDMHARLERLEEEGRAAECARAAREASAAATPPEPQAAPAAPQAPRRRRSWRLGALLRPLAKVAAWLPLCGNSSAVTD